VQPIGHDGAEEPQIVLPLVILKYDDFKIVVSEADAAGDLEIAAVVSYAGDQRKTGAILRPIHRYVEARDGPAELPESAVPISQFSQLALEIRIEFVNDARVQSYARHENEMAARQARPVEHPQSNAYRCGIEKLFRGVIGPVGETDFVGQNIGRPGRQNAKRNVRAGNSVDRLVDGAVAARREDEIAACVDRSARKLTGRLRARSGNQFNRRSRVPAGIPEDTDGGVQTRTSAPFQTAGERVVYDSDTMGL